MRTNADKHADEDFLRFGQTPQAVGAMPELQYQTNKLKYASISPVSFGVVFVRHVKSHFRHVTLLWSQCWAVEYTHTLPMAESVVEVADICVSV